MTLPSASWPPLRPAERARGRAAAARKVAVGGCGVYLLLCAAARVAQLQAAAFLQEAHVEPRAEGSDCFVRPPGHLCRGQHRRRTGQALRAVQQAEKEVQTEQKKKEIDPEALQFETVKFNVYWDKMKEAEEHKSPELEQLRKKVENQGRIVEELGGSLPAQMLTLDQAKAKADKVIAELDFGKLWSMSNEERWALAQSLGPAFPISLVLSYTLYWLLNIPFIAYTYFTAVVPGTTQMPVVMAAAYATSVPFKPLIYIGAILGTAWTAQNVMPLVAKVLGIFRLPDESDWDRL